MYWTILIRLECMNAMPRPASASKVEDYEEAEIATEAEEAEDKTIREFGPDKRAASSNWHGGIQGSGRRKPRSRPRPRNACLSCGGAHLARQGARGESNVNSIAERDDVPGIISSVHRDCVAQFCTAFDDQRAMSQDVQLIMLRKRSRRFRARIAAWRTDTAISDDGAPDVEMAHRITSTDEMSHGPAGFDR